jgi:hypothetical protein
MKRLTLGTDTGVAKIPALLIAVAAMTVVACSEEASGPSRWVVQGPAEIVVDKIYDCPVVVDNYRVGAIAVATETDGTRIRVPADTAYEHGDGPRSYDLYNECTQVLPADSSEVDTDIVPVVDIDPDGEVITGFIVADNYYELYVNGQLVSVDNTPYTPFNSAIVKFRVKRPYTLAFMLVDWDEHMGLGMELFPQGPRSDRLESGDPWFMGDAGMTARFSDGTVTGAHWKAQSFAIAPLDSPDEVTERTDGVHDTSQRGRTNHDAVKAQCTERGAEGTGDARLFPALNDLASDCYAVHYPIPADWMSPDFDDSSWPQAFEFTDEEVSTPRGLPAYFRYLDLFEGASFIWTQNLVLDNLVIVRYTVQ